MYAGIVWNDSRTAMEEDTLNKKAYAVLTGDIVNSSELTSSQSTNAMQWLRDAAKRFGILYPQSIYGELDTFRHDSWQILMVRPELSFRLSVYLRTSLKLHSDRRSKFDSRISVGIGEVEFFSESRISDSRGNAFTVSGRNLDTMSQNRLVCAVQDGYSDCIRMFCISAVPLLDCIVTDWTPAEAQAINGTIEGLTQERITELLPPSPHTGRKITRQAVSDSLKRGYWSIVADVLHGIEGYSKLWGLQ